MKVINKWNNSTYEVKNQTDKSVTLERLKDKKGNKISGELTISSSDFKFNYKKYFEKQ